VTNIYPTASNALVFMNGYHIDQAFRIDIRESTPKIPIYGYNDYTYTKGVGGRTLIRGMLVINFTHPAYLNNAILSVSHPSKHPGLSNYGFFGQNYASLDEVYQASIETGMLYQLPSPDTPESRKARAEYIASLLFPTEDRESVPYPYDSRQAKQYRRRTALEAVYSLINEQSAVFHNRNRDTDFQKDQSPGMLSNQVDSGLQLEIYYTNPRKSIYYVTLTNVQITDVSQQISQAGAEGSAEPLYEVYQFIAAERNIRYVSLK
jgi:hypothetical protein